MKIKTPKTIDDAINRLDGIGKLITATEWERAAIVATFVRLPGSGALRYESQKVTFDFLTCEDFRKLDVQGLRSTTTVRKYVQAWLAANDGEYPQPNRSIDLPTDPWPPTRQGTDGYQTQDGLLHTIEQMVEVHGPAEVFRAVNDVVTTTQPLPPVIASPVTASPVSEFREHVAHAMKSLQIVAGAVAMMGGLDGMRADDAARLANLCDVWESTIAPLMLVEVPT